MRLGLGFSFAEILEAAPMSIIGLTPQMAELCPQFGLTMYGYSLDSERAASS